MMGVWSQTCLLFLVYFSYPVVTVGQTSTVPSTTEASSIVTQVASNSSSPLSGKINDVPGLFDALEKAVAQALADWSVTLEKIFTPELYYSYGRSPPVYPSRKTPH